MADLVVYFTVLSRSEESLRAIAQELQGTLGAGDPGDDFAALQVELFDALMTTFRWRTP